jgi:phage terminase large subunit-like protein
VKAYTNKIVHPASGSYFTVVSSIAEAMHGASVHGAIIDELHVHKSAELVETVETGTGSRREPLVVTITTADDGRPATIYARKRNYVEQLASQVITDEATYGVVWGATEDDDPFVEETWRKANPGYGVSPSASYLRGAATEAKQDPAALSSFLRLHLGIRTKQVTKYISLEAWDRNAGLVDEKTLAGRVAYGGLDLSRTHDLTALAWLFPKDGAYDVIWRFWVPEARLPDLIKRTAGGVEVWQREGWLTVTDGNVIDYEVVKKQLRTDLDAFDVQAVGYDRWNATQLVTDMTGEGAPMVPIGQGYQSMSAPLKEMLTLLLRGNPDKPVFRHGGNPVMRWMVDNLAVSMDAAGNVKPDKEKAADNIDGVSAAVTALSRAMLHKPPRRSAYEDHDLQVV